MTQFISKRGPFATVRRLSGKSEVVSCQDDLSFCAQELKFLPDIKMNSAKVSPLLPAVMLLRDHRKRTDVCLLRV